MDLMMFQGDCCRQHSVESRQPQATGVVTLAETWNAFSGPRAEVTLSSTLNLEYKGIKLNGHTV